MLIGTVDFSPDTFGGVNRCVFKLSKGLAQRGQPVAIVTRRVKPELQPYVNTNGFQAH